MRAPKVAEEGRDGRDPEQRRREAEGHLRGSEKRGPGQDEELIERGVDVPVDHVSEELSCPHLRLPPDPELIEPESFVADVEEPQCGARRKGQPKSNREGSFLGRMEQSISKR